MQLGWQPVFQDTTPTSPSDSLPRPPGAARASYKSINNNKKTTETGEEERPPSFTYKCL